MRHSAGRKRAVMAMLSAVAMGVGFGYASAAPQPVSNAAAAKVAAAAEPASPVYVMADMTRQLESVDHQALVEAGMLLLADYLPPYITPYSKTKDASQPDGVRFRPDLCTLGKPDKPFFYVIPGAVDSIIDENGKQVSSDVLKGLQMWAVAMDGDGRKASGTVFALRAQMPDGMWKPWEVRGYVNAVLGDGTETIDLGQVDFITGGKSDQLGFLFKDVKWNANHTAVHFDAVTDPLVWVVKSDIAIGDESKVIRGGANAQWSPPERLGPAAGLAATGNIAAVALPDGLPSTVHVKVEIIKNARLVRVPFVFRTGPDEVDPPALVPQGKPGKATLPNYVMSSSVRVYSDPPPPAPKPAPSPAVAPVAKPVAPAPAAVKPAPPVQAAPPPPKPAPVVKHAPNLPTVPADLVASYVNGNLPKPAPPPPAPTVTTYKLDPDPPPAPARPKVVEAAPPPAPKPEVKPPAPAPAPAFVAPEPIATPTVAPTAVEPTPAPAEPPAPVNDKKRYKVHDKFGSDELPEAGQAAN